MKKLLLTLLLTIFLIPIVNADTILTDPLECFSIAPPSNTKNIFINTANNLCGAENKVFHKYEESDSYKYICVDYFFEVKPDTTYTFTHFNTSFNPVNSPNYNYLRIYDSDFTLLLNPQEWFSPPYTITMPSTAKYVTYCSYNSTNFLNFNIQLEEGAISSKADLSFVAYEELVSVPEDPETPIVADTTLDSFYSIYLDRLSLVSMYAIENKFLLGTLGIILLFIVLEIILNLFRKGGYR